MISGLTVINTFTVPRVCSYDVMKLISGYKPLGESHYLEILPSTWMQHIPPKTAHSYPPIRRQDIVTENVTVQTVFLK